MSYCCLVCAQSTGLCMRICIRCLGCTVACMCGISISYLLVALTTQIHPLETCWVNQHCHCLGLNSKNSVMCYNRTQLSTTFVGDQLTLGAQIGWSYAGQWQVDQDAHLDIPDVEPEASAALVALAWCFRTVGCPTPNVQPHSGHTAAGLWDLLRCRKTVNCSSPGDTKWTLCTVTMLSIVAY